LISSASLPRAFYQRRESLRINYLIYFISTSIASIICDLNAWLDVTASSDDTFNDNQRPDGVGSDFSHFDVLFFGFISWDDAKMVGSFQFWRDA